MSYLTCLSEFFYWPVLPNDILQVSWKELCSVFKELPHLNPPDLFKRLHYLSIKLGMTIWHLVEHILYFIPNYMFLSKNLLSKFLENDWTLHICKIKFFHKPTAVHSEI